MLIVALIIAAYVLGSIPFGLLIGCLRGVDIRRHGSRNIGATNVGRVVGRPWGFLCLALDVLKGLIPTAVAGFLLRTNSLEAVETALAQWLAVACAAVLGHNFSIFLRFRGGKGVATTIGVALGLWPFYTIGMAVSLAAYAAGRFLSGWVSAGSLAMAVTFPIAVFAAIQSGVAARLGGPISHPQMGAAQTWPLLAVAVGLSAMIIFRHRENIQRIFRGEERRMTIDAAMRPPSR